MGLGFVVSDELTWAQYFRVIAKRVQLRVEVLARPTRWFERDEATRLFTVIEEYTSFDDIDQRIERDALDVVKRWRFEQLRRVFPDPAADLIVDHEFDMPRECIHVDAIVYPRDDLVADLTNEARPDYRVLEHDIKQFVMPDVNTYVPIDASMNNNVRDKCYDGCNVRMSDRKDHKICIQSLTEIHQLRHHNGTREWVISYDYDSYSLDWALRVLTNYKERLIAERRIEPSPLLGLVFVTEEE